MDEFTIYCTPEQTKKAIELDAPIDSGSIWYEGFNHIDYDNETDTNLYAVIPTAEQMLGYLRMRGFKFSFDDTYNYWAVLYDLKIINKGNSNNKELAAIDAVLEYLIQNKNK